MIEATHERLSAAEKVVAGSDRSFGVVMAVACSIIALINLWQGGWLWAWIGAPRLFPADSDFAPDAAQSAQPAWLKFGLLLHQVVNPIVLALLFFGTVLPTGLVMRALGQGPAAAEAASRSGQLLDRAAAARAGARDDEGSVLKAPMDFPG